MSAAFAVVRTSRKRRRCGTQTTECRRWIEVGDRYRYSSVPPGGDLGHDRWMHNAMCTSCMKVYGHEVGEPRG